MVTAQETAKLLLESDDIDDIDDPELALASCNGELELRFSNGSNRNWRAVMSFERDRYTDEDKPAQPTITFYDLSHSPETGGQQVSTYHAATLMERPFGGLDLYGGIPAWQLSSYAMAQVRQWIRTELETKRGLRLKGGRFFGSVYEDAELDPDSPEIVLGELDHLSKPEDVIKGSLQGLFNPYYTSVSVESRPGMFKGDKNNLAWIVRCRRDTPLALPAYSNNVYMGGAAWRDQVRDWLEDWASKNGMHILQPIGITGRLRLDPTFTFETYSKLIFGHDVAEALSVDDPDAFVDNFANTAHWQTELQVELSVELGSAGSFWRVMGTELGALISGTTYYEPTPALLAKFRQYIVDWITERQIMPIKFTSMNKVHARGGAYPEWNFLLGINIKACDQDEQPPVAASAPAQPAV